MSQTCKNDPGPPSRLNFRELGFTEDFGGINFRKLSLGKDFSKHHQNRELLNLVNSRSNIPPFTCKARGGVRGHFCMFGSYESTFYC